MSKAITYRTVRNYETTSDSYPAGVLPKHLSPVFEVVGIPCFMETPKLAAVPVRILKAPVASLAAQHPDITAALDFLFQGY